MYAELDDLKLYLGIESGSDDTLLYSCLVNAQGMIEARTQRVFEIAVDSTRRFDALTDVCERTLLFNGECAQVTQVVNGDGMVVPGTAYLMEPPHQSPNWGLRLKRSAEPWTYNDDPEEAIAVTGRWGYSVTPPADIVQATLRLAAFIYRQKDNAQDADRPLLTGDGNVLMPSRLPNDVAEILRPYTRKM